ncbi:hypothetical protein QY049_03520 [Bradyrhizobium sp. WYCCWR 13022]|uniref:hypothetical protein n=1 Tax=unclassified Bradyrhizobium TaxID=2631580 RepID=UPI00263A9674|nr:hypothetical protein [Bradyrhizobium sp. WYCCWR 13022]MDN4982292.1 hypothetical protein [Bradyrhizobium sp. WYCCWR 13022]
MSRVQKFRSHEERSAARRKWMGVPPGMTPALADEFMRRLVAGDTLRKITSGDKQCGPALVTAQRFKKHCQLHPEWGADAMRLADANFKAADASKGWKGGRTHCKSGHPYAIYGILRKNHCGRAYRYCTACVNESYTAPQTLPSSDVIEKAQQLLKAGIPVRQFTTSGLPRYLCKFRAVRAMRLLVPGFNEMVLMNQSKMRRIIKPIITTIVKPNAHVAPRSTNLRAPGLTGRIAGNSDYLFTMVEDVVPRALPRDIRMEVISMVVLDVLDGKVRLADIKRTAHRYASNLYNEQKYIVSLDAPAFREGGGSLIDRLSDADGLWA